MTFAETSDGTYSGFRPPELTTYARINTRFTVFGLSDLSRLISSASLGDSPISYPSEDRSTGPQRPPTIGHSFTIPHTQPASGLRRQPELCQQAAGVTDQDGVAIVVDARGMVSG